MEKKRKAEDKRKRRQAQKNAVPTRDTAAEPDVDQQPDSLE
jgi:hypothetical protein